jgi:tRNA(Ser,Leu) C12 N-acetylase TAN1
MQEWNVVISVHEQGFKKAVDLFGEFGTVKRTEFFNVLLLRAGNVRSMLEALRERSERAPDSLAFLARVVPVTEAFTFNSAEEFEARTKEIVLQWVSHLANKSFHVRLRRRGFKGRIVSPEEERFLDEALLRVLEERGQPGRIEFDDADIVIAIETVGTWAGLSLWTREELEKYPFVRV